MTKKVIVVGGYGNFGAFIARRLSRESSISLIIAGRSGNKARALAESLNAEWVQLDIFHDLDSCLSAVRPDILVHTSGPFQTQSYHVAEACIRHCIHYIDLADGRDFVTGIARLNDAAIRSGVIIVSGASSVPGLTSSVFEKYRSDFTRVEELDFGIGTAHITNRGLATAQAVLSYAGKAFKTRINGEMRDVYGWQGLSRRKLPGLGWRLMSYCDVPDLSLFPQRYPELKTIRFRAGLELPLIHFVMWLLTWPVRLGAVSSLQRAAPILLAISRLFDFFGSDNSGFFLEMRGRGVDGKPKQIVFDLTARAGSGLMIPCIPAIVLVLKLVRGELGKQGYALPCFGLIALDQILEELRSPDICWAVSGN